MYACTMPVVWSLLSLAFLDYRHGLASSAVHLVLSCNGDESHILNCDYFRVYNAHCSHLEDVEIICCKLLYVHTHVCI